MFHNYPGVRNWSIDPQIYNIYMRVVTTDGQTTQFQIGTVNYQWDPSGYIFDANTNERIEGATVTLWWRDPITNQWVVFPGEMYNQINPVITNEEGEYAFHVPVGDYRVEVTAPGYEPSDNILSGYGPIRVLPIHTEVNIGLTPSS
jgi:hypothetical protein